MKRTTPTAARYRPKYNMLELDYTINPASASSNSTRPLLGGANDRRNLQKRTHASNSIDHVTHAALAKLDITGTRLDLVPLRKSVFQMRPTFHHLHDQEEDEEEDDDRHHHNNEEININDVVDDHDDVDIHDDAHNKDNHRRPIMFAKKEMDPSSSLAHNNNASSSSSSRRNAYAQKCAEEASEEWLELHVLHGSGNDVGWGSSSSSSSLVWKELMDEVQCGDVENELRLLPLFSAVNGRLVGDGSGVVGDDLDSSADDDDDDGGAYVRSLNYLDSYSAGRASGEAYVEDLSDWTPSSSSLSAAAVVVDSALDKEEDVYSMDEPSLALDKNGGEGGGMTERATAELAAKLAILLQHGNGTMIPYCVLRSRFQKKTVSDSMLLAALSSCAVLVRGNFALKSSLAKFLHTSTATRTATRTMGSGVGGSEGQKLHAKSMNDLRDLILLLLNKHGAIQRERLMYVYSNHSWINPDTITFVLKTVAKRTSREESCWVAKVDDDEEFAAKFPEVAACHVMYWMKRKEMLAEAVRLYEPAN